MMRFQPIPHSTRNACSLFPWQATLGLPPLGPVIGLDNLSGGARAHYDPWELYNLGILSGPNALIIGQIGQGKSALTKAYLGRQILLGKKVAIIDPKGEYESFAAAYGIPFVRLEPGGKHQINPLDPGPRTKGIDLARHRVEMLAALAACPLGREPNPMEWAALTAISRKLGPTAQLSEVLEYLATVPPWLTTQLGMGQSIGKAQAHEALRDVALSLYRLIEGDLEGMFGPTTVDLDWSKPGIVVDISAVFHSDALAPVMVAVGAWLTELVTAPDRDEQVILVLDEAWAVLRLTAVVRWLQAVAKLARTYGVQLLMILHRLSDLASQTDDASAAMKIAHGLLSDVETKIIFRQPEDQASHLVEMLGLTEAEATLVTRRLQKRVALWIVGSRRAVIEAVLTDRERQITDTDAAMRVKTTATKGAA